MREEMLRMSTRELKRLHVVQQVMEGKLLQRQAAEVLGRTARQVRRWVARVRQEGPKGLIHRLRGRCSNRKLPEALKVRVLKLYQERYGDFGPTLTEEKLRERENIRLGRETVRRWLTEAGLWQRQRKASETHRWRERKACAGELVQMDGSHHDWLEGRGPALVLMAYIDDATSRVYARFYDYEGTLPAMDSFKRYVGRYGLPQQVYADRHTTYQSPGKARLEDELQGRNKPQSQFERALAELGVRLIPAYSPQAKGRVERLFRTFQDRLIKELRLAGIDNRQAANRFLETYLPRYNKRFSCQPRTTADLHRPNPGRSLLDKVLVIRQERILRQDQTVQHEGKRYLVAMSSNGIRPKHLKIEDRLNGRRYILDGERVLHYREVQLQPKANPKPKPAPSKHRALVVPSSYHPWKRPFLPTFNNRTILKSTKEDISTGR